MRFYFLSGHKAVHSCSLAELIHCSVQFSGIRRHVRTCDSGLGTMDRNDYYKRGFKDVVKKYSKWDLIDQDQAIRLIQWVQKDRFLDTSTAEYKEIITVIKHALKHEHR